MRALLTVIALLIAAPAAAAHRVATAYTRTDDVRAIAALDDHLLLATGGGLAVHGVDGGHRFTLTARDGLPGNSLRDVARLGPQRAIVSGDFGAAVITLAMTRAAVQVVAIDGAAPARPSHFAPITVVRGSAAPGCADAQGPCALKLLHQHRGVLRAERDASGRWRATGIEDRRGPWSAAVEGPHGAVFGAFDGRLMRGDDTVRTLSTPVQSTFATTDGVWIATGQRLLLLMGDALRPVTMGGREVPATALGPAPDGGVVVGAVDGRIWRSRGAELELLATAEGRITAVAGTADGAWIGLAGSGLHRVTETVGPALRPAEICSNHIARLTRHRGALVAGTFHRGVCALTADGWVDLPVGSPFVFGVASDGHFLWVASSAGIDRFGPELKPAPYGRRDPRVLGWLTTTAATAAIEMQPGTVAIASGYGLAVIRRDAENRLKVRFTGHRKGAPYGVNSLAARGDDLIVGSEKHGITVMTDGAVPADRWQDPVHLPENWVVGLDAAPDGTVWVGTCQEGAAAIDRTGKARRIGVADGLPDRRVTAVAATADGAWIGTLGGLAHITADRVLTYGTADGIADPRSSALFVDGETVWLATEAGLVQLQPDTRLSARLPGD